MAALTHDGQPVFGSSPFLTTAGIPVFLASGTKGLTAFGMPVFGLSATAPSVTIVIPFGSLSLSSFAPALVRGGSHVVIPPVGSLVLTGFAPSIVRGGGHTVVIPVGSLVLTGYAPTAVRNSGIVIIPPTGSLTLTGFAPTIVRTGGHTVVIPVGSLVLTGYAPTVVQGSGGGGTQPLGYFMSMYSFNRYGSAVPVTPSDAAANHFSGLQVATAGNLVVTPKAGIAAGSDITYTAIPAGAILPFEVLFVKSTGTTATVIGLG